MKNDYSTMTDDELTDIRHALSAEYQRRAAEPKKPVFIVDGIAYKNVNKALDQLVRDISFCQNFELGPSVYFERSMDEGPIFFGLKIAFLSLSDYNSRTDEVYGY